MGSQFTGSNVSDLSRVNCRCLSHTVVGSLDFTLTFVSVLFNYAGPFFLKWVLERSLWGTTAQPFAIDGFSTWLIGMMLHRSLVREHISTLSLLLPVQFSRSVRDSCSSCTSDSWRGLSQAQADLQHLWFGRRACTRIRSELMAAIYDKALKRKDYSGIVNKDKKKEEATEEPTNPAQSKRMIYANNILCISYLAR